MTQEEFARRIGISQNYLSTMERGNVQIGSEILLNSEPEFGKIDGVASYRRRLEINLLKFLKESAGGGSLGRIVRSQSEIRALSPISIPTWLDYRNCTRTLGVDTA